MPSRASAFSLLAAVLLLASLGLKARLLNLATDPDLPRYNMELSDVLAAQGFDTRIDDRLSDYDFVLAMRGTCQLRLRIEPTADLAVSFRSAAKGLPLLHYRYGGTISGAYPRGRYDIIGMVTRMAMRLGLAQSSEYPLAIGSTPDCPLESIDFGSQRIFPKLPKTG